MLDTKEILRNLRLVNEFKMETLVEASETRERIRIHFHIVIIGFNW